MGYGWGCDPGFIINAFMYLITLSTYQYWYMYMYVQCALSIVLTAMTCGCILANEWHVCGRS